MVDLLGISLAELSGLGLNTATVVLLYKMHRDLREVAVQQRHHWSWIARLRAHVWPAVFRQDHHHEPETEHVRS